MSLRLTPKCFITQAGTHPSLTVLETPKKKEVYRSDTNRMEVSGPKGGNVLCVLYYVRALTINSGIPKTRYVILMIGCGKQGTSARSEHVTNPILNLIHISARSNFDGSVEDLRGINSMLSTQLSDLKS